MRHFHLPQSWRLVCERIFQERPRKILVLGGTDRGKSTLCRFLVRALVGEGHAVSLVDGDIGQKTVGPPAAVTVARVDGAANTGEIEPQGFYFVGSTGPSGRLLPLIIGTARLAQAAETPFVIIDTTGYIEGTGRILKGYKIEAVQPDLIVAVERRRELDDILNAYRTYPNVRVRSSRRARPRDVWERDRARQRAFASYFRDAERIEVGFEQVTFQRAPLFVGSPMQMDGALYAEQTCEGIVAIAEEPLPAASKTLRPGFERGLLCGVADARNRGVGLAILDRFDFDRGTVSLTSPVTDRLHVLQLGDLYLDQQGYELGRVGPEGW